ncbi:ribulose phosphate epimerase [Alkalispirochaeta sphaeroplastigenens]|uniref:Ribulose-phosphate 3-epimerase n=1 Tax=Alkalispirochaeta sphaeroplastigenens TaxID=1187066 RepID=A0A2S4K0C2_9SPIO|nr:ribulose-phosphate 3-epimerase [Alkalispirochaeta sphaeroplastigenens]POR05211.1 ribulose phosphate epimerase [Alkalispirochaeta sphaeroplastigenens]
MNNSVITAPSILAADFANIVGGLSLIEEARGGWVHMDVMDGHFVPNISFGPKMVRDVRARTDLPLDVHLMVSQPERYTSEFIEAGADYLTVHLESTVHVHRVIQSIRRDGARPGLAIVPSTPVAAAEELLDEIDLLLIMTVNPGFGGQALIPRGIEKVARAVQIRRERGLSFRISVDGGVNHETAPLLREAGVDVLVSGSAFFSAPDPSQYLRDLCGHGGG